MLILTGNIFVWHVEEEKKESKEILYMPRIVRVVA